MLQGRITKTLIGVDKIVKSELIHETWKNLNGDFRKTDVEIIINEFISNITTAIKNDIKVKLDGLGVFSSYTKEVHMNIPDKEKVIHNVKCIKFSPSENLKQ